ncbi:hypothetical protein CSB45_06230 [candidate division KSB3 bacterium]|uniref:Uncharacterized protein n=1 Tax=candidate division KSB3 bacterium TaxID=2044937 RepID=A0A2G6E6V1_9BACT|nr:MAG: hypothetical protein CSB45_06230 [candidate division KSB3 bacterium]PIE30242.1 MAG: hypothetical protein CSA57_04945 [candidate division KSB3 bacterium]
MSNVTNDMDEFDFIDSEVEDIGVDVNMPGFRDSIDFDGVGPDIVDKTEIIICTKDFRLRGKVSLVPGARLTDYIIESHQFIAVTDAEVRDIQGRLILHTPFLDINRDHIVLILPYEFAKLSDSLF